MSNTLRFFFFVFCIAVIIGWTVFDFSDERIEPLSSNNERWQETQVNSFTNSTQGNAAVDIANDGSSVVAWDSRRQQNGTYGVYLQRFDLSGKPIAGETQVNLFTRGMQMHPAISIDGQGSIWVAWESFGQDGSLGAIMARRFDSSNDFAGGDEILVNEVTEGQQSDVVVVGNDGGGVTFCWVTSTSDNRTRVAGRTFDGKGKPQGAQFYVARNNGSHNQNFPSVAIGDDSDLMVSWAESDSDGVPEGIYCQVMDCFGMPKTGVLSVNQDQGQHIEPAITKTGNNGFAIAWLTSEGEEYAVFARRFNRSGQPVSGAIRVSSHGSSYVSGVAIAADENGRLLVSWNQQAESSLGRNINVQGQTIGSNNQLDQNVFCVNQHVTGRHRLAVSGKQRVKWYRDRLLFAWNGPSESDSSAVNLTVRITGAEDFDLASATGSGNLSADPVTTARPHEPPTYDPKRISRAAFGGDSDPVPGPGMDFGFIGITNTGWTPPDPSLAVGPNHLVGMTNGEIAFFDKNGNLQFQDEIENSFGFWGNQGATGFVFDPEVVYDPHSERFIAMANERSGSQSYFLLAVSDDSDPNGDWNKYRLNVTSIASNNIDSPNLAVDDEAVYLTADFFGPDRYLVYILQKSDLIAGNANPLATNLLITGSQSYGIPTIYDENAPAFYMIQAFEFGTFSEVRMHAVTDQLGSPTRVTVNVTVPSYGHPQDPPQQGTSARPELFEARFWSCVYRNGSLWAVHHQSPNSTGTVRARWYEFDMQGWPESGQTPVLVQSGDIFPGTGIRTFFPSIWVDSDGNAAITFARSATSEFLSMSRTLRAATDPPGTFQPVEFVRQSESAYGVTRWGDYSGTASDPAAPGTFWGMHEYTPGSNSWNTWIAKYELESAVIKGDLNGDGTVDLLDVQPFIDAIAAGVYVEEADTNCDGMVNLLDVSAFIDLLN